MVGVLPVVLAKGKKGMESSRMGLLPSPKVVERAPVFSSRERESFISAALGQPPDAFGVADHTTIGDAWERSGGDFSIIAALFEQLGR